jgi:hypothetical protein
VTEGLTRRRFDTDANVCGGPDANIRGGHPENAGTMSDKRAFALVLAGLAAAAAIASGCGEKDEPELAGLPAPPTTTTAPTTTTTTGGQGGTTTTTPDGGQGGSGQSGGAPGSRRERTAEETVGEYIAALNAGDGTRVCSLLVPGALEGVDLPFRRGGCGPSLSRSIGYRDPRGLPVFAGARLRDVSVRVRPQSARAVATVVTSFADRAQPSIEDDVIYLVPDRGRRWLIAKPSATLYRAVGIADVPPSVIAPPR